MRTILNNQNGSAFLIALVLILMVGAVAAVSLNRATTDIDLSYNQVHEEQAFYVAEAGANLALAELLVEREWRDGFSAVDMGNGVYSVSVLDSTIDISLGDTVMILANGSVDGTESEVALWLLWEEFHPFVNGMFGRTLMDVRNSLYTDSYNSDSGTFADTWLNEEGSIGSNDSVRVYNGAVIGGDASTATEGSLGINPGAIITGDTTDAAPPIDFPILSDDQWDYAEANNAATTGITGSYSYNPSTGELRATSPITLSDGVYFFSSMVLTNSAEISIAPGAHVEIYVTGDIELKQSSALNAGGDPGDLLIYSQGDFVLKNSGEISAVFYNPEGVADLRNSGDFYGAIVADSVIAHNSATFHYDRSLRDLYFEGYGAYDVVAWEEVL